MRGFRKPSLDDAQCETRQATPWRVGQESVGSIKQNAYRERGAAASVSLVDSAHTKGIGLRNLQKRRV